MRPGTIVTICLAVIVTLMADVALADRKSRRIGESSVGYLNKTVVEGAAVWYCWYSKDIYVNCMLGDAGTNTSAALPVSDQLPAVVDVIINAPRELMGSIVRIPLMTIPYSHSMVGELAESIVCGRRTVDECVIIYGESNAKLANLVLQREAIKTERLLADRTVTAMTH